MGGLYEFDDILTEISRGNMQSFSNGESWVVTQVHKAPRKTAIEIFFAVGNMNEVLELEDEIIEFGRKLGATVLLASGRKGWLRRKMQTDVRWRSCKWRTHSAVFMRDI
jgi:hypothetical protein